MTKLDVVIRNIIKKELVYVPRRAKTEYFYGRSADILLGIPLAAEDSDILVIEGALKLLTSADELVLNLAWKNLTSLVACRLRTGRCNRPPLPTISMLPT